ncbi:MAG: tetratricopeptide repeat protein, partial [Terracidiphilus sp.]
AQSPASSWGDNTPLTVAQARAALAAAEAAHPGNTPEVAAALDDLVGLELEEQVASQETLTLANRELAVARASSGERSKAFVAALSILSEVYVALSRPAQGRPYAERALAIAQNEFPDSEQGINAADQLAFVCIALADFPCAERADLQAIAIERKPGPEHDWDLATTLSNYSSLKERQGDLPAAGAAIEEALAAAMRSHPDDAHIGVLENNLGLHLIKLQKFPEAIPHFNRAIEIFRRSYGDDSTMALSTLKNVAGLYSRTGQFALAWKDFELAVANHNETVDDQAHGHAEFARSLASGGDPQRAIAEGLLAARMGREHFVLEARTLPERQALAYDRQRPRGLDTALSVLARHPDLPAAEIYQEVTRSRALVADEMGRRQRNLNAANDPGVARLLQDLDQARAALIEAGKEAPGQTGNAGRVAEASERMEAIERQLAERSALLRADERVSAVELDDLRRALPTDAALVSYMRFDRRAVDAVDPARTDTPAYMAFVLRPGQQRIRVFDLGDAASIEAAVTRMRATADA